MRCAAGSRVQRPPGPRKSGIPDSVPIPAPASTNTRSARPIRSAAERRSGDSDGIIDHVREPLAPGATDVDAVRRHPLRVSGSSPGKVGDADIGVLLRLRSDHVVERVDERILGSRRQLDRHPHHPAAGPGQDIASENPSDERTVRTRVEHHRVRQAVGGMRAQVLQTHGELASDFGVDVITQGCRQLSAPSETESPITRPPDARGKAAAEPVSLRVGLPPPSLELARAATRRGPDLGGMLLSGAFDVGEQRPA